MQKTCLVGFLVLAAACERSPTGPAVPRISSETIDRLVACDAKVSAVVPQKRPGELEMYDDITRRNEAKSRALTDELARSCGFASRAQYDRFLLRFAVARLELIDLEMVRDFPDVTLSDLSAKRKAEWKAELAQGEATEEEIAARRRNFQSFEATITAAHERVKRRAALPPKTLDVSELMSLSADHDAVPAWVGDPAQMAESQRVIAAEGLTQPPLSAEELDAVRAWQARARGGRGTGH